MIEITVAEPHNRDAGYIGFDKVVQIEDDEADSLIEWAATLGRDGVPEALDTIVAAVEDARIARRTFNWDERWRRARDRAAPDAIEQSLKLLERRVD